ncbi:hypothetical protein [Embleya scabrispora]|uniref:hypothetical protein n=1 Tax=Embleya scabrispora TaxID=159449 RepID=UPI00117E1C6D|nr:hypothetical protein [Embleya scabrispora]
MIELADKLAAARVGDEPGLVLEFVRLGLERVWEVTMILVVDTARECPSRFRDERGRPSVRRIFPLGWTLSAAAERIARARGRHYVTVSDTVLATSYVRTLRAGGEVVQRLLHIQHAVDVAGQSSTEAVEEMSRILRGLPPDRAFASVLPIAADALRIVRS